MESRSFPFLDGTKPLAFLHRAGSVTHPNSLTALQQAVKDGFRYIETDVRSTADHVAVLMHDRFLGGENSEIAIDSISHSELVQLVGADAVPRLERSPDNLAGTKF